MTVNDIEIITIDSWRRKWTGGGPADQTGMSDCSIESCRAQINNYNNISIKYN